jgi:hypothetical protein
VPDVFRTVREIGDHAGSDGGVFGHHLNLYLELVAFYSPPHLLIFQFGEEILPACLGAFRFLQVLLEYFSLVRLLYEVFVKLPDLLLRLAYLFGALLIPYIGSFQLLLNFGQIFLERSHFFIGLAVLDCSFDPVCKGYSVLRGFKDIFPLEEISVLHYNALHLRPHSLTHLFNIEH